MQIKEAGANLLLAAVSAFIRSAPGQTLSDSRGEPPGSPAVAAEQEQTATLAWSKWRICMFLHVYQAWKDLMFRFVPDQKRLCWQKKTDRDVFPSEELKGAASGIASY